MQPQPLFPLTPPAVICFSAPIDDNDMLQLNLPSGGEITQLNDASELTAGIAYANRFEVRWHILEIWSFPSQLATVGLRNAKCVHVHHIAVIWYISKGARPGKVTYRPRCIHLYVNDTIYRISPGLPPTIEFLPRKLELQCQCYLVVSVSESQLSSKCNAKERKYSDNYATSKLN